MRFEYCKLGEIASPEKGSIAIGPFGSRMKADTYRESGIPIVRGNNISDTRKLKDKFVFIDEALAEEMKNCILYPGDIYFPHRGAIGEVGIIPMNSYPRFMLSTAMMKITVNKEIANPYFVYYYFRSPNGRREIFNFESTVGTPGIGQPLYSLRKFNLPLPELTIQNQISEILVPLDDLIDCGQKICKNIDEMISALFQSWFVDLDPVIAKAEGKSPYGMDEETAALFPDSFEDSEHGPIPAGWEWGQLGDCVSVVGGGTPSTKNEEFWDGKYNWTSPKDLSNSNSIIMLDTERTITEAGLAKVSSGLLPKNTVLMSSRAPIGYLALTKIPVAINQGYIAIPPKNNMSPNFMLSWIHYNMPLVEAYSSGSTFPEISKKEFRKLQILIPPAELIEKFNEKTTCFYASMETSLKQMNSLKNTRDTLLPRLMSGELKVPTEA